MTDGFLEGARRKIEEGLGSPMDDPDSIRQTAMRLMEIVEVLQDALDRKTEWGCGPDGRSRKPCPEKPVLLLGAALGQYHCPGCVEMQIAGLPHLPPDKDYELVTGHAWPPGYDGEHYEGQHDDCEIDVPHDHPGE